MRHGAISATVRFVCHTPLFVLAYIGTKYYLYVKKHAQILLVPPYDKHKILAAEGFSGPGAIVASVWNFVFWIPTIIASDETLIYYGLVDAAIVLYLLYALCIESTFVGWTRPQCATVHANAIADPHLLFFYRADTINMTSSESGESICKMFLVKWYITLVVTILYFVSAISNILACKLSGNDYGYPTYGLSSRRRQVRPSPIKRKLAWLGFPLVLVYRILDTAFATAFAWLPKNVQGHMWCSFRSARRWARYKISFCGSRFIRKTIFLLHYLHRPKASDEKLAQILLSTLPYDVLQLIAAEVHYVDLVNLSMVSKRVQAIMFPRLEDNAEDRQLRFHSCKGNEKSSCWTCGVQVCKDCWRNRDAADSITSSHMRLCEVRCSKCFYGILSRPRRGKIACECYRGNSTPFHRNSQERHVCQDCNKLNDKKLITRREKRDQTVYYRLTLQSLACANCRELLPKTGLRWWVDTNCRNECRATCHPGYIEKEEV